MLKNSMWRMMRRSLTPALLLAALSLAPLRDVVAMRV